ncbi:MAG: ArsC/Spx/MgsR family protein [bacterium]
MSIVNLQIFGTNDCQNTRKAERFFKERGINFQYRNLADKGVSKGELESIMRKISLDDLFNAEGKQFKKRNMNYMKYDKEIELLSDPLLFTTPIVRTKTDVTIGFKPEIWKNWIAD